MKLTTTLTLSACLLTNLAHAEKSKNPLTFHYNEYENSVYSNKLATINWNTKEGMARFEKAEKGDFFRLAHHFKAQQAPSTCGIAAAVTVMGAIYEKRGEQMPLVEAWPINFGGKTVGLEYRTINETNFFNDKTDEILNRKAIVMRSYATKDNKFGGGIDMEDLAKMLKINGVKSEVIQVKTSDEKSVNDFREVLIKILKDDSRFLIANFNRSFAGMEMGGHYSPIVGYDKDSDSVLVMDVAEHKNPWIWVNIVDFHKSMNSKTYSQKDNRGYMILKA